MNGNTGNLTLSELLERLPDTAGKRLPTSKMLRKAGIQVFAEVSTETGGLVVYENGYFTYTSGRHTTVQSVHKCRESIRYDYGNGTRADLGMETFGTLPFAIRLTLEGEIRLEQNQLARDSGRTLSYDTIDGRIDFASDEDITKVIETQEERESLQNALSELTDRQRRIIVRHLRDGLTQQQVADELGISKQTVNESLHSAMKRLRKSLVQK